MDNQFNSSLYHDVRYFTNIFLGVVEYFDKRVKRFLFRAINFLFLDLFCSGLMPRAASRNLACTRASSFLKFSMTTQLEAFLNNDIYITDDIYLNNTLEVLTSSEDSDSQICLLSCPTDSLMHCTLTTGCKRTSACF